MRNEGRAVVGPRIGPSIRGGSAMSRGIMIAAVASAMGVAGLGEARGQDGAPARPPMILGLFPPGASAGATTEWPLTGRDLGKPGRGVITGGGVEVVETAETGEGARRVKVRVGPAAEPGVRELRAAGPGGVSNLALFRVDRLPQAVEAEPNDDPARANPIAVGSAVAGVLKPQDLDHFRLDAR